MYEIAVVVAKIGLLCEIVGLLMLLVLSKNKKFSFLFEIGGMALSLFGGLAGLGSVLLYIYHLIK